MIAQPTLSIVLPCYNEAAGLESLLNRFVESGRDTSYELILVDNGSTDGTSHLLPKLLPQYPFARSVRVDQNQGYGHGILTGLRVARGEVLAWSHADLQTDPGDVFRAFQLYQRSSTPEQTLVKGRRTGRVLRERVISLGMQFVATILLRTRLDEINAQPKLFHRNLLALLKNPPLDLNLDLYALYVARQSSWRLQSIEVAFPPRQHGESSWATSWRSKFRTISRSVRYMLQLAAEQPRRPPVEELLPQTEESKVAKRPAA